MEKIFTCVPFETKNFTCVPHTICGAFMLQQSCLSKLRKWWPTAPVTHLAATRYKSAEVADQIFLGCHLGFHTLRFSDLLYAGVDPNIRTVLQAILRYGNKTFEFVTKAHCYKTRVCVGANHDRRGAVLLARYTNRCACALKALLTCHLL